MKCFNCPITGPCQGDTGERPHFCTWAATGNPQALRMIIDVNPQPVQKWDGDSRQYKDSLVIRSHLSSYIGYGQIVERTGHALESLGLPTNYASTHLDDVYFPISEFMKARRCNFVHNISILQLAVPYEVIPDQPTLLFTMWETSRLKPEVVANINKAVAVVVPCRWNAECFRASGVTVPIHIVPLGVAAFEGYTLKPYPQTPRPFTFGMAARMAHGGTRKGLNEGMVAFVKAFPNGEPVALEVKVWEDCLSRLVIPDDDRIHINTTPMLPPDMAKWYESIDVYFVPSKAEGWGLHTLQAMACGRPVIATKFSGTADFFNSACGWELEYDEVTTSEEFYSSVGTWGVPREESMIKCLREAYKNPQVARFRGSHAALRASRFTWDKTALQLRDILLKYNIIKQSQIHQAALPSLFTSTVNLTKSAMKHVASGMKEVTEDQYQERIKICKTSGTAGGPCRNLVMPQMRCGGMQGCSCYLETKGRWADQECPIGLWKAIEIP